MEKSKEFFATFLPFARSLLGGFLFDVSFQRRKASASNKGRDIPGLNSLMIALRQAQHPRAYEIRSIIYL